MTHQSISMNEGLESGAGVRGFAGCAGFPPPRRAGASTHAGGVDTAADRGNTPCQSRKPLTRGTVVTPVLAMVIVSMPPSPGPSAGAIVVVRRWATPVTIVSSTSI
jgi:hypothetical protein